jgi:vacuolar-type H+-ATPase subunit F/Vma7
MKVYVIGGQDLVQGFSLAGACGMVARTAADAERALAEALARPEVGLLLVGQSVAPHLGQRLEQLQEASFPLVLEVPETAQPSEARRTVRSFVRQAIGIEI